MPITINGSGTITGVSVGGLPDGIVDTDMIANNAVTSAKSTITSGLAGADVWRLTSDLTGNQMPITTSDMERADDSYMTKIGTGMSYSSGVFSFPDTGIWKVTWIGNTEHPTSTHQTVYTIEVTTNNGGAWDTAARSRQGVYKMSSGNSFGCSITSCIIDVTDTSNVKVRFEFIDGQGNGILQSNSLGNETMFEFLKLAET